MKKMLPILLGFAFVAATGHADAQNGFNLKRSLIVGGGGTSSGGTFALSGAAGQAEAAINASYGGRYALAPGFWAGKPSLQWLDLTATSATRTANNVTTRLAIVPVRPGWKIQVSPDLLLWSDILALTNTQPLQNVNVTSGSSAHYYFRLRRTP